MVEFNALGDPTTSMISLTGLVSPSLLMHIDAGIVRV